MDIYVYKKEYYKESPELQSSIISAINVLYERITEYEKQVITFEKICNDDKVKYDKNGDFYTFKFQKSNMQLRILYAYIFVKDVPTIIVTDFFIKKKNNKQYIKMFEYAKNLNPYEVFENSKFLTSN